MNTEAGNVTCVLCGRGNNANDIMMDDGFYSSLRYHVGCINSPQGKLWQDQKFREDPAYERYWDLQTIGKIVTCHRCSLNQAISAKARGMGAGNWEVVCDSCHRVSPQSLSGYKHPEIYRTLGELEKAFLLGLWDENCEERMRSIAQGYCKLYPDLGCVCGGHYSILGKPRCVGCSVVILDSYFHYSYDAPSLLRQ